MPIDIVSAPCPVHFTAFLIESRTMSAPRRLASSLKPGPKPGPDINTNGNPDLGFSPKKFWGKASPRTKIALVVGLGAAVAMESTFWVTFGPKIFGKTEVDKREE